MKISISFYAKNIYFSIGMLLTMPFFVSAATEVTSNITTDTTWTAANSPYVVSNLLVVEKGVTLTLLPGVVVKFNSVSGFSVEGKLIARGMLANKIYFTSIKDDSVSGDTNSDGSATIPQPRDWMAVFVVTSGTLDMDNAIIRYGGGGLCNICHSAGIFNSGRIYVSNSEISHNGRQGLFLFGGESTITSTDVNYQEYGFNLASVGVWNITQNIIHDNSLFGMFNPSSSSVVDATHNWWGDASGPYHPVLNPTGTGDRVSNNALFDPWLTEEPRYEPPPPPPVAACCSNVAFIPGMQASRLDLNGNRLWEPNSPADTPKLFFDELGNPSVPNIVTDGIIDEAFGFNIYKSFIEFMNADMVGAGIINEWTVFPYDWRFSIEDAVEKGILQSNNNTYWMVNELERLAASSKTGKVTIIAHSNGGLVAKSLISKLEKEGKADLVDKLILIAVPQLGTPKALAGVLHGDEQTIPSKIGILLTKESARELAENMPSAYILLPSQKYFSDVFDPVIEFDPDVAEIYDFPALYGDAIDSRSELDAFVLGDNGVRLEPASINTDEPNVLGRLLLQNATSTQDKLDAWSAPTGIKVIQIAGWGIDTIRGIRYDDCDIPLCPQTLNHLDRELLLVHDGDGTVVIPSAVAIENAETYYVDLQENNFLLRRNRDHADILEVEYLKSLLTNLIKNETVDFPAFITNTKPTPKDEDKKLRFRIHSPASLDLYDAEGNHTGLIQNPNPTSDFQRIEQELPNSYYLEFGETKYAGADTFATTSVVLVGQANGMFTFEIDEVRGDELVATTSFINIPVIEGARITTDVQHIASSITLSMDMDADGTTDAVIQPGEGVSRDELLNILRGMIRALELSKNKETKLLKSIDKLEKVLKKEYKNEKIAKNKTAHAIESLERTVKKFQKKGLLTTKETEELLHIIEQIK